MKISVITDAVSADYFFPIWHHYYSSIFGAENLHVIAPCSEAPSFETFTLGSLTTVVDNYDDGLRLDFIQNKIKELLFDSEAVVRVDTDEIIVADPAKYRGLKDYFKSLPGDYATARGFDVFQATGDGDLRPTLPILGQQRKFAFANTAMNKTCFVKRDVKWNRGFHCINNMPNLGDLFLFHLKRVDINWQVRWNAHVASKIQNDAFIRSYYETPRAQLERFHSGLSERECVSDSNSVYRELFIERWLKTFRPNEESGTIDGEYIIDTVNIEIPERFWGLV